MDSSKEDTSKYARRALILFPQSKPGIVLFYAVFMFQVGMYAVRDLAPADGSLTFAPHLVDVLGLLIDVSIGVFSNLLAIWLIRWILVKVGLLRGKESHRAQFAQFFSILAGTVILITVAIPIAMSRGLPLYGYAKNKGNSDLLSLSALSSKEQERFKEIQIGVMQGSIPLTPKIHAEFWRILTKAGIKEQAQVEKLRDTISGISSVYQRYLWGDAQRALKEGRPFKSSEREQYEKRLLMSGEMTDAQVKRSQEFVVSVAEGKVVHTQHGDGVITADVIQETLAGLAEASIRLTSLFTP